MSVVGLLILSSIVFAATDIDDLFLLIAFFSNRQFRARQVVAGQFLGIGCLVALSLAAALLARAIPDAYIGLLGLAPIAIGIRELWEADSGDEEPHVSSGRSARGKVLSVAAVTLANGGDNIGVYAPLFATHAGWEIALMIAIFAGMTFVWCAGAYWLVRHPTLGSPIRRYGRGLLPFVLIALGLYILFEAGTFGLLAAGRPSV